VLNLPAARPDIAVRAAGDLHLSGGVMVGQRQFGDLLQPGKPPYLEQSPPRATRARAGAGRAALIASTGGPGPAGGSRDRAGQLCALAAGQLRHVRCREHGRQAGEHGHRNQRDRDERQGQPQGDRRNRAWPAMRFRRPAAPSVIAGQVQPVAAAQHGLDDQRMGRVVLDLAAQSTVRSYPSNS
jgi:hypothetical protein